MPDLPAETPAPVREGPPSAALPEVPLEGPDQFLTALDEDLYQQTRQALAAPEQPGSARSAWIWLAVTLGLFVLSILHWDSYQMIGWVILVLLFHEAGHFLGMRLFGYQNVRMFFIPFFGAAVSGKKHAAPAWQQALVLLLGPLPGILAGVVLVSVLHVHERSWPGDLALWLLLVNGFNLVPLVPLDGGRLIDLLLFSRRAVLSAGFQGVAACGLAALAWWSGAWVLWLVAFVLLLTVPVRYRTARLERVFAGNPAQMPARLEDLDERQHRELFHWAVLLDRLTRTPAGLAEVVRQLHQHMVARRPRVWTWLGLVLLYLAGWAGSVGGLIGLLANTQREDERLVSELVADFDQTTQTIVLREKAADFDQAEKEWKDLVSRWHSHPEPTQTRALRELIRTPSRVEAHPFRRSFVWQMAEEMEITIREGLGGRGDTPFLGIAMGPDPRGCKVSKVLENSPAARASLEVDDIIRKFDGQAIKGPSDVHAALSQKKIGDTVILEVQRGGQSVTLQVRLGRRTD